MKNRFPNFAGTATFALTGALLLSLLSAQCSYGSGYGAHIVGTPFALLAGIGHFAALALVFFLLFGLFRVVSNNVYLFGAPPCMAVVAGILTLNTFTFEHYHTHLTPDLVKLFLSPAGTELVSFTPRMIFIVFGVCAFLFAATFGLMFFCEKMLRGKRTFNIALITIFTLSFLTSNLVHAWAGFTNYAPVLVRKEAIPYAHLLTANRMMKRLGFAAGEDRIEAPNQDDSQLQYPIAPLSFAPKSSENLPNVLFVFLDSWRRDSFNEKTMPYLHKLAQKGIVFKNHFSGGNATRIGIFSFFYSIPPNCWHTVLANGQRPVLLEAFAENGYEMLVSASANLTQPEFNRTVFAGIENLRISSEGNNTVERDTNAEHDFFKMLDKRNPEKPFFGFLFYDALHNYALPEDGSAQKPFAPAADRFEYFSLNSNSDPEPIRNLYSNSAYNLDIALKRLFTELEKRDLPKNTIIVLTGDHGQEIKDTPENRWGHNSNFSEFQIAVPMIIFSPGKAPATYSHRTTHFDMVPTLLGEIFGCTNPKADYSSGKNIFDESARDAFLVGSYNTAGIVAGDAVYAFSEYGFGEGKSLDFSKEAPPIPPELLKKVLTESARFYKD